MSAEQRGRVGVLVMAYGTPASPADVERYYTDIRRGRAPTPELLAELRERYEAIGGISPLLQITRAQVAGIGAALEEAHPGRFVVALGQKHTAPFIEDGAAELLALGVERIVGLVLAPHFSTMSIAQYAERAIAAVDGRVPVDVVRSWHLEPGYLDLLAGYVTDALADVGGQEGCEVLFTAHSLPQRILEAGDPYPEQLAQTAAALAARAGVERWSVAWQSAGRTADPWIGPDVLDVLRERAAGGTRAVVVCACGFVADHLEVLYDLDIEARGVADELGLAFARTRSPNADPTFTRMLAGVALAQAGLGAREAAAR
ncbi:MAG TPA: ferrochelatase [Solirubrobacteraceae bacterium]|nr:ferrochelatase [Solirubrobacteraceae bacterium]